MVSQRSRGALAELSFQERNFLGRGQYLKITGGYGEAVNKYELSFTEPYFLGRRISAGFDASYTVNKPREDEGQPYEVQTTLFRPRISARVTENLVASVNYTYQQDVVDAPATLTDPTNALFDPTVAQLAEDSPYITSAAGYSFVYSSLDSLKNPREGIYARFDQQIAGLGGDAEYLQTTARATAYYTVSDSNDIVVLGQVGGGHIKRRSTMDCVSPISSSAVVISFAVSRRAALDRGTETRLWVERLSSTRPQKCSFPFRFFRDHTVSVARCSRMRRRSTVTILRPIVHRLVIRAALMTSRSARRSAHRLCGTHRSDRFEQTVAYPIAKADFDKEQVFRFGVSTRF